MAALIAAILLGGQAGTAAIVGTQAALVERQLQYSRSFEEEADAIGIQTLASAGYDPRAMPEFFGRLQQWSRNLESNAPEFLRTHPLTYTRIAESRARADQYQRVENRDETQYQLMKAKIRALYTGSDPSRVSQGFAASLKENTYQDLHAEQYGYALALMADGEHEKARTLMSELISLDPGVLSYSIALADIEVADSRPEAAAAALERARQDFPDDLMLDLYFIKTLIESEQHAEAKKIIKSHLISRRGDPRLHRLLARAEGETGNHLAAHQELAEFYYFIGNPREALRQLNLAEKYTGDSFYAKSSVSARIQEIKQELLSRGEQPQ
jgi:predicted Zn-dependent protease